ncbi:biotin/lipoate--protein ligase family protein [Methylobacterium sp. CM6257]
MTVLVDAGPPRLVLPPGFSERATEPPSDAHSEACRLAASAEAETATLVLTRRDDLIDLAVVLAPAEPLVTARRAVFAGMVALANAVGAFGPPEIPVTFGWPGTLLFNGARLGGGRLGWPEECPEDEEPDWLVFSGMLIASKLAAGDPGHTPDSTALEEEGFGTNLRTPLVESFARHLTKSFEIWREDGFDHLAALYLAHLPLGSGVRAAIEASGDGRLTWPDGRSEGLPLRTALEEPSWHDRKTGGVRL